MALRLVERALVKDFANIARADTLHDHQLDQMIQEASDQVSRICGRQFTYGTYREFHQSYDQDHFDPTPQWIWVEAFPIDVTKNLSIMWAPYELHDQAGVQLLPGDYTVEADKGAISVRKASGIIQTILPLVLARPIFQYAPKGFRIDYTGGYPVSTNPDPTAPADPLDDYGVVQVPYGMKAILAQKIAADWKKFKNLSNWTEASMAELKPYKRGKLLVTF